MRLINADLDKTITIREVMEALDKSTEQSPGSGYFSYECSSCGYEDEYYVPDVDTIIDESTFEDSLVRRLDRGE